VLKYFYQQGILKTWKGYFPDAVSYNRFIELNKEVIWHSSFLFIILV